MNGRAIIGSEMGLGKSLLALLTAEHFRDARPVVIVCPASIKWMWEEQARQHMGLRVEVLEGTRPPREGLKRRRDFVVVNYDILGQTRGSHTGPGWLKYLKALNPQMVILDEIQAIKNRTTLQGRSVKELCRGVPHVLGLSGTPLVNRPAELWHPLHVIRPKLFPSFHQFAHRYTKPRRTPWGWDFSGASNLDELHGILTDPKTGCLVRRRKANVLDQLPPKRRTVIPLDLMGRREYQRAVTDFLGWLAEHSPAKARRAARAQTIVQLGELKRLAARLKLPAVFTWVDGWLMESDEKLVIFAIHRSILKSLHERYRGISVRVDGSVTGIKRQQAIDKFILNKRTRLFLGNIKAAGTGWSAKGVSEVAFVEIPWSPGDVLQAEDRAHGIGRGVEGRHTSIHFLVAKNTIEEKLLKIVQTKQGVLDSVLDGKTDGNTLDVFDLLEKALLREARV